MLGFIGIILASLGIKAASDWSITSDCKRKGYESFKRAQEGQKELYRKMSKEADVYYEGSICGLDFTRHADGTLKNHVKYAPGGDRKTDLIMERIKCEEDLEFAEKRLAKFMQAQPYDESSVQYKEWEARVEALIREIDKLKPEIDKLNSEIQQCSG